MKIIPGGIADKLGKKLEVNWETMKIASEITDEDIQKAIDIDKKKFGWRK